MKLEKLSEALAIATEHGLDGVDLAILGAIHDKRRSDGAATIMQFSNGLPFASFGTIHARVKRMVKKGFIRKHIEETNQRCKILEDGPKLEQFLDKLSDV